MSDDPIRSAYGRRAEEYVRRLGSVAQLDARDAARILAWAEGVDGAILDAGCGPGQWAGLLHAGGHAVTGVDLVPAFVAHARAEHPAVDVRVGSLYALDDPDDAFGGALAWYSLIHDAPPRRSDALAELRRVLAPGGALLVGFFVGATGERFEHAVAPAFFWSVEDAVALIEASGFEVVDIERRSEPGARPHASIAARARSKTVPIN